MIEHLFSDERQLIAALSGEICRRLKRGVEERGQASFVATGGATPGPLYDALSQTDPGWEHVWVTLSDERWVSNADPASNERLVRERLLQNKAAGAHLAPLLTEDPTPQEGEEAVDARIAAMPRPFDVVLLGMGADGHIASLFPMNPALERGLDIYLAANVAAVDAPGAHGASARMTLTLSALLDARWVCILVRGEQKLALARGAREAEPRLLPVAAIVDQADVPVDLYWAP